MRLPGPRALGRLADVAAPGALGDVGEAAAGHIEEAMTAAVASLGATEQRAFYALCTADGRSPSAHGIWLSNAYLTDKRPEMRAGIFEIVPMAWLQVLVAKCGSFRRSFASITTGESLQPRVSTRRASGVEPGAAADDCARPRGCGRR